MILYSLACEDGHRFDAWFRDSAAFEDHRSDRLLSCPVCASTTVAKTIMAPAVLSPQRREVATAPVAGDASRDVRNAVRRFRARILAQAQDVGPQFAGEARRIHDGDAPDRQIYGQASIAEARDLLEDGIMVLPLPDDPDAAN